MEPVVGSIEQLDRRVEKWGQQEESGSHDQAKPSMQGEGSESP
ncbi:MAG: hypothetical protein VX949_01355 [Planctomycetota bacterium]|nr:hypothetical protein [Planctomycetota bacterium]